MRFLWLGLLLALFPVALSAHPEVECVCHSDKEVSYAWLTGVLYISATLLVTAGVVVIWLFLELPEDVLPPVFSAVVMYAVLQGSDSFWNLPPSFWAIIGSMTWTGFCAWLIARIAKGNNVTRYIQTVALASVPACVYFAYGYESYVAGFFAVAALAAIFLNVKIFAVAELAVGIPGSDISTRMTVTGMLILGLYLVLERLGVPVSWFTFGAMYISSLIINSNLLVATWGTFNRGLLRQVVREVMFLGYSFIAIAVGQLYDSAVLVKFGGTFVVLWILLKTVRIIFEILMWIENFVVGALFLIALGIAVLFLSENALDLLSQFSEYIWFL